MTFLAADHVVSVSVLKSGMSYRTILEENYRPDVLFIWTSAHVCIYPADAVLRVDGFLPSADAVKTASARTQPRVRVGREYIHIGREYVHIGREYVSGRPCPRGRQKK
jgi:hypothetical protein